VAAACSGQDAGVPLIAVNGIELYYESHGTGAPLVVLRGLGLDVSEMGQRVPDGKRLTPWDVQARVVTGATGLPDARSWTI
jgi:hypothetical protein